MDNFREWLSDNLRYFMLGGAILVIVAVLFFGVRACVGSGKGASDKEQKTAQDNSQGNDPSSPEDDGETNDGNKEEDMNPLEKRRCRHYCIYAELLQGFRGKRYCNVKNSGQ